MGKFQDLNVWQRAKDLAVYIDKVTNKGSFSKDFSLRDQIRKAAVSIPSNIAEGDELSTDKQSIRHFYIAKGSSAEVSTQGIIALEIKYIDNNVFIHIEEECRAISGMLSRLIKARSINSHFSFRSGLRLAPLALCHYLTDYYNIFLATISANK